MKVTLPIWPDLAIGRLADVSDQDLIKEMLRRKRLYRVEASLPFFAELRDEPGYIPYIKKTAFTALSRAFLEDPILSISNSVFTERPENPPTNRRILTAGLTFLQKMEGDEDAATGEGKA